MHFKSGLYHGYVIVAASALIMIVSFGVFYSYSVFFDSLLNEFHWNHVVTAGVFSLSSLAVGLVGIILGRVSDQLGPRKICLISGVCLGAGYLLLSMVKSSWQVYLIYALLLPVGLGGLWPSLLSTVARWFTVRRGLLTGIITAGVGFGSIIFPPLLSHLILISNWRQTYLIVGIISLVLMLASAAVLRSRPNPYEAERAGQVAQNKGLNLEKEGYTFSQVVLTFRFWVVVLIYVMLGFSLYSIMVHIVPFATGEGISPVSAAAILGVIGAGSIISRMLTGVIADKIQPRRLLIFIVLIMLVSLILLELAHPLWSFYIFGFIFGLAYGASSTITSLLAADLYGLRSMGIFIGILNFGTSCGCAIGPIIVGYIFDVTANYHWAFTACLAAALFSVLMAWLLPHVHQAGSRT
jgi:MFS family permease